jgi:hypothetical protein|tara:strand:+ start:153 stop:383 length:231 start_codon:yes stop_codon:yes gene_type:complete
MYLVRALFLVEDDFANSEFPVLTKHLKEKVNKKQVTFELMNPSESSKIELQDLAEENKRLAQQVEGWQELCEFLKK